MINAVKIRHEGLPKDLHISYDLLIDYIKKNGYKPITPAYCMVVRCDNEIPSNGIIDIYIGLNSNIL
jgi:effector-binding domain-containing protein